MEVFRFKELFVKMYSECTCHVGLAAAGDTDERQWFLSKVLYNGVVYPHICLVLLNL